MEGIRQGISHETLEMFSILENLDVPDAGYSLTFDVLGNWETISQKAFESDTLQAVGKLLHSNCTLTIAT